VDDLKVADIDRIFQKLRLETFADYLNEDDSQRFCRIL
jgi:hypothetical protein